MPSANGLIARVRNVLAGASAKRAASLPYAEKIRMLFGPCVVDKGSAGQGVFRRLPRYVSEFMIASCPDDLELLAKRTAELLPDPAKVGLMKERLVRERAIKLIDRIEVVTDLRSGMNWAKIPALGEDRVFIEPALVRANKGLLTGGMWGTVQLGWAGSKKPLLVLAFEPLQADATTVDEIIECRRHFSTEEWVKLLLASVGVEADVLDARHRMLLLMRLIPLVERNVNIVELGPRQTGKTFLLRNTSPGVFVVSGGKTTPAVLFGNLSSGLPGIFATHKVVVLDEIAATTFADSMQTVSMLKDYLESGQYSRGSLSHSCESGLVLTGNIDVDGDKPHDKYEHLFEPLPEELQDTAFLDRIHGYLPGWELPKISHGMLTQGAGFVVDYFGAYLIRLRDLDVSGLTRRLKFAKDMTRRDTVAVERLLGGWLKLLYPDGRVQDETLNWLGNYAVEMRQRVHNQLVTMAPGEFRDRHLSFAL